MLRRLTRRLHDQAAVRRFDRLARRHPLRYLFIEITRRCNLACAYCGSDCSPARSGAELRSADWIAALQQVAEEFEPRRVMLAFTGGEPLTKSGFFDVIAEARRLGFPFGMVSNGALIDREAAARLVASGIGAISLSLDGPPAANDALRGRGVALNVAQAVQELRAAGYKGRLEIISTITKPVVPLLDELRRHIATLQVAEWRLAPVIPIGRAADRPELLPDAGELRTILEFVRQGRRDGYRPVPEFGEECYLGHEYEGEVRPFRFLCLAGLTVGGILCDGRIGACPELADDFVQGDIRHERFADVWRTRYAVFRNRDWTRRGPCGACDAFSACRGGSLHLYSDLDGAPSRCFYKMLTQPAADSAPPSSTL